ncbi:phage portal protein [Companilactobacillus nodensis]|uniref:phage portal protein n=1 Tax=Companilactobacillus nodensis TaxID=460870 RepID=UPI0006854C37|nr:phage portal protein [Companilactobacillus nodensis]
MSDQKWSVTDDSVFLFPQEDDLTADDIKEMVKQNQTYTENRYKVARQFYKGHHPILDKQKKSDIDKPDNCLVVNYPKYIVDTFNGFFDGIPPKITLDDEDLNTSLQDFVNYNSLLDLIFEASKQVSIYGRSYFYIYQNEDKKTCVTVVDPIHSFIIYDDTVAKKAKGFVMYSYDSDNNLSGQVCLTDGLYDIELGNKTANVYKNIPAIEFFENEERQGTFENIETLVNGVNNALSQKANDVEYFADAYMKILGSEVDEDTLKQIKDNHIINLASQDGQDVVVEFMEKPNADGEQENLINRLNNLIFQISMVANISDDTFGNAASGVSLQYKLLSMRNLASNKERKLLNHFVSYLRLYSVLAMLFRQIKLRNGRM